MAYHLNDKRVCFDVAGVLLYRQITPRSLAHGTIQSPPPPPPKYDRLTLHFRLIRELPELLYVNYMCKQQTTFLAMDSLPRKQRYIVYRPQRTEFITMTLRARRDITSDHRTVREINLQGVHGIKMIPDIRDVRQAVCTLNKQGTINSQYIVFRFQIIYSDNRFL